MTYLDKVLRPNACLDMVLRPSACLDTVPRLNAMTCLDMVPRPNATPSHGASVLYNDMPRISVFA